MILDLPDNWKFFEFKWDAYRNLWETFCIAPLDGEDYWFKGLGPTVQDSLTDLTAHVISGAHVAKPQPSRYVKGAIRDERPPRLNEAQQALAAKITINL